MEYTVVYESDLDRFNEEVNNKIKDWYKPLWLLISYPTITSLSITRHLYQAMIKED
jgi:hypothetical protein